MKEAAGIERELAAQNPAAYRPDLALTLNNLGALYGDTHRFAEAEAALKEAAGIGASWRRRTPPPTGPTWRGRSTTWEISTRHAPLRRRRGRLQGGRRHLARAGGAEPGRLPARPGADAQQPRRLYGDTHRFADAEAALRRPPASSASWRRRTRPPTGLTWQLTLNNLGILHGETQRFADAEAAFKEAAGIQRELAAQNPAAYRPDLAQTLNNLGDSTRARTASPTPRPP